MQCARISVRIGNDRVNALVDSCASVSLVSLDFVNKYGLKTNKKVSIKISTIFGASTKIKGSTAFKVRIGPRTYTCKALVLEQSMYPLLLGLDWLLANKCKLNFDQKILEFPNGNRKPIMVMKEEHRVLSVRSKLEVILQGGERALIPVKIPDLYKIKDVDGIVYNFENKENPWMIARSLIKVRDGFSLVEITNMGIGPWKVRKNQQVGWFEYEPTIANAILLVAAIEVEDVPRCNMDGNGLLKKCTTTPSQRLNMAERTNACKGSPAKGNTKGNDSTQYLQEPVKPKESSLTCLKESKRVSFMDESAYGLCQDGKRTDVNPNGRKGCLKLTRNTDSASVYALEDNKAVVQRENKLKDDELNTVIGHLPQSKQAQIKNLLLKYQGIFASNNSQPGTTNVVRHEIDTGSSQPISQAPYRSNPEKRKEIQRQVQSLLDAGQIECSTSPWASPILLVPKKDGGWRMCVDYRKVNAVTKKVSYPIPRTEDTFDYLLQARWFSKVDAASGFWQVPMEASSKEKTAMITPDGLFQWKVMPFGLCNAPATFQRLMDVVLSGLKWKECLVYLDDVLIFSKDWDEHLLHLNHVFDRLEKANISLKLSKCEFAKNEIQFLGHIVKDQTLIPDERNVEAVRNFPQPKDLTGTRAFLGLVGHYRRFIPKFADKSEALRKLLKKGQAFVWEKEQQDSFKDLKNIITEKPVLGLPDFSRPFKLSTDASNIGISAVLSQIDEAGRELYVIGYRSRALRGAETNYSTIEKEMLAIIYGLQKFDYYLMGTALPFEIVTDHQPLCHLPKTKDPYGRIGRWALLLQGYNYKIKHLPGQQNVVADVLSRFFAHDAKEEDGENTKAENDAIQQKLQELVFTTVINMEDPLEPDEVLFPKWFEDEKGISVETCEEVNTTTTMEQSKKVDWFKHWRLNPKVFQLIDELWGPIHTDLFATLENRQVERYYSQEEEDTAAGKDAFAQPWEYEGCYANPPWSLLERTVQRVKEERLKLILISPFWPSARWFKMAVKICTCAPVMLGRHEKLYLMHDSKSRAPAKWSSVAWLLDGSNDGVENWNIGEPMPVLNWDTLGEPKLLTPEDIAEIPRFNKVDYNHPHRPTLQPVTNERLAKSTFLSLQEQDKELAHAFEEMNNKDIPEDEKNFKLHDGRLCRIVNDEIVPGITKKTLRLVIPKCIRKTVVYACHDDVVAGHLGYKRTLLRLQQRFWWPKMTNDVKWYVRSCRKCQFAKRDQGAKGGPLNPLPPRSEPFEVIGMDLVFPMPRSKNGNIAILVWEDYSTRWSEAIPLEDTSAATIGRAFWFNIVCRYGCPRTVLTDLGRNFMASMFEELLRFTKTDRLRTTAYHPQTDGLVERQNQTLKQMIRTYVNRKQDDWDELLPYLSFAYNTSVHSSTGVSPYFLMYGREATMPVDVAMDWTPESQLSQGIHERMKMARRMAQENLIGAQNYQRRRYDERHGQENKFNIGDIVLVRTEFVTQGRKKSISPRFSQLARVIGVSPGNIYKLRLGPRTYSWINVERMKKYHANEDELRTLEPWLRLPVAVARMNEHDVEGDDSDKDDVVEQSAGEE